MRFDNPQSAVGLFEELAQIVMSVSREVETEARTQRLSILQFVGEFDGCREVVHAATTKLVPVGQGTQGVWWQMHHAPSVHEVEPELEPVVVSVFLLMDPHEVLNYAAGGPLSGGVGVQVGEHLRAIEGDPIRCNPRTVPEHVTLQDGRVDVADHFIIESDPHRFGGRQQGGGELNSVKFGVDEPLRRSFREESLYSRDDGVDR